MVRRVCGFCECALLNCVVISLSALVVDIVCQFARGVLSEIPKVANVVLMVKECRNK